MKIEGSPNQREPSRIELGDLKKEEYEEALGPANKYNALKSLGHDPSDQEALDYYLEHSTKLHARIGRETLEQIEDKDEGSQQKAA